MGIEVTDARTGRPKIVCGAKTRAGTPCLRSPVPGRSRCSKHGGHARQGDEAGGFIHGKYSKVLRRDVLGHYLAGLKAEDPYSQREEIALFDARISMLLEQTSLGAGWDELLSKLRRLQQQIVGLLHSGGPAEAEASSPSLPSLQPLELRSLAFELGTLVAELEDEGRKWAEVYTVVDHRRKLIESERKRELDAQKLISEREVMVLISALLNAVRKHVADSAVRAAISAEIIQLGALPAQLGAGPEPGR